MQCPKCGGKKTRVLDTRGYETTNARKRICISCGHRFRTWENLDEEETHAEAGAEGERIAQ
jgi:transcriptional repressor NrdR